MNNKSLAELQIALQNFLLDKTRDATDLTSETPSFSARQRLGIYHDAYRLRLIDTLRNDYPALEMYVGNDDFIALANEFITANPSHHPSLRWLGIGLHEFLQTHIHWRHHIHAAELAAFEWAQVMTFDAADITTITVDDIRSLKPEQWMTMQLEFHPSVHHLRFISNAPALWSSFIKDNTRIAPTISEAAQDWLIWRENLQVVYRPLDRPEAWALENFLQRKNFAEVCSGLCEWFTEEQVPLRAATYLQQWINAQLITKISTSV